MRHQQSVRKLEAAVAALNFPRATFIDFKYEITHN